MPIMECLKKMKFSDAEAMMILADVGDGKASEVVQQHLALLEQEHADIQSQIEAQTPKPEQAEPVQAPDEYPQAIIPADDGPMTVADARAAADAAIVQASELSKGMATAAECAMSAGQ